MSVLQIDNISKSYGAVRALNNVSFSVPKGTVFGILGPNGSGKTTLLGIVMDVLKASGGSYSWDGKPSTEEIRKQIGTLLETPNFYHYMSAEDNLKIAARIKGSIAPCKSVSTQIFQIQHVFSGYETTAGNRFYLTG
jgi:ABC-2 type transport system ATP-binding protein